SSSGNNVFFFLLGNDSLLPNADLLLSEPFCSRKMDEGKPVEGKEDNTKLQYYYNEGADICFPFFYKGLEGNGNRFNTDRECMEACSAKFDELYPAAGRLLQRVAAVWRPFC
uniref:BPTI/Kunitz inhibitor domain-containing protein n=1 Tax=Salmo trutta TaxID=8032 RepID=A0A674AM38_SALTR